MELKLLCAFVGYLCGTIMTADIVVKLSTGKNIRTIGTGNPGMANVMAEVGKKEGVLVLLGDILKTILGFVLAWLIAGNLFEQEVFLWSGIGTILGHNFPFWSRFKGGKGVTVTCTFLIIIMPLWGTLACILGGIITIITGFLPLGSVLIPLFAIPFAFYTIGIKGGIAVIIAELIMISRHYRGVLRIIHKQEERKFRRKT